MSEEKKTKEQEITEAREWLKGAHVFYPHDPEDDEVCDKYDSATKTWVPMSPEENLAYKKKWGQAINLNDVWCWARSDCTFVEDEELPELARLVRCYGWCGALYFCYKKDDKGLPEFEDIARFVQFVEHEEALLAEKDYEDRAYHKLVYTLGEVTSQSKCRCGHYVNWHEKDKGKCNGEWNEASMKSNGLELKKWTKDPCGQNCEKFDLRR